MSTLIFPPTFVKKHVKTDIHYLDRQDKIYRKKKETTVKLSKRQQLLYKNLTVDENIINEILAKGGSIMRIEPILIEGVKREFVDICTPIAKHPKVNRQMSKSEQADRLFSARPLGLPNKYFGKVPRYIEMFKAETLIEKEHEWLFNKFCSQRGTKISERNVLARRTKKGAVSGGI